jgi:hypothetical protein
MPTARHAILAAQGDARAVRVRMTDIFDQAADAVIAPIATAPVAACKPLSTPTTPGLRYELWTKDEKRRLPYFDPPSQQPDEQHAWIHLAELSTGKKVREGISRGFDPSIREDRDPIHRVSGDPSRRCVHPQRSSRWCVSDPTR